MEDVGSEGAAVSGHGFEERGVELGRRVLAVHPRHLEVDLDQLEDEHRRLHPHLDVLVAPGRNLRLLNHVHQIEVEEVPAKCSSLSLAIQNGAFPSLLPTDTDAHILDQSKIEGKRHTQRHF